MKKVELESIRESSVQGVLCQSEYLETAIVQGVISWSSVAQSSPQTSSTPPAGVALGDRSSTDSPPLCSFNALSMIFSFNFSSFTQIVIHSHLLQRFQLVPPIYAQLPLCETVYPSRRLILTFSNSQMSNCIQLDPTFYIEHYICGTFGH